MKWFFTLLLLTGCSDLLFSQPQSPEKKAEAFFRNGFSEFEAQNYDFALTEFKKVFVLYETRFHDPAHFYAGLCYFHKKNYHEAINHFQKIIDKHPESKYKEEAIYHKGLSMLQILEKREGGLYVLMELEENASNKILKKDIQNAIQNFLYSSSIYFLEKYYPVVRAKYKSVVAEALGYQYYLEKQNDKLSELINQFEKNYPLTDNLKKLKIIINNLTTFREETIYDTLKIAVVLPLNANEYGDSVESIKIVNRYALEFLYGLEYGLQNKEFPNLKKIILKTFDSRRDSNYIKQNVLNELMNFQPQVLVGELVASNSQILSQFCEENHILQIIPFANTENLVSNKNYTFLQNATLSNQTAVLAKWIVNKSEFKNILAIFDDTPDGKKSAQIFQKETENAKIPIKIQYFEHGDWQNSLKTITYACFDTLNLIDGIFMNIQKQEHFELLLNRITRSDTVPFTLMTINDIRNFNRIDGKKWFYFSTIFTQFFDVQNRIKDKEKILFDVQQKYKINPNSNFYQGMDISEILYYALTEKPNGRNWKQSFEAIKPFQGYNQNYYFGQSNSNQSIKLFQFQKNGVQQLEIW